MKSECCCSCCGGGGVREKTLLLCASDLHLLPLLLGLLLLLVLLTPPRLWLSRLLFISNLLQFALFVVPLVPLLLLPLAPLLAVVDLNLKAQVAVGPGGKKGYGPLPAAAADETVAVYPPTIILSLFILLQLQ